MILLVLTIFVVGTLARWKAVRGTAGRPAGPGPRAPTTRCPPDVGGAAPGPSVRQARPRPARSRHRQAARSSLHRHPPTAPDRHGHCRSPSTHRPGPGLRAGRPARTRPLRRPRRPPPRPPPKPSSDAEGPALILTSNPALWDETKDARAKLGPVLLYDPTHLCDTPARLHWSPTAGCEDRPTAAARATALLAPVRPTATHRPAVGRHRRDPPPQLPPRRRDRRPPDPPRPPLVPGHQRPGSRTHPAHQPQGGPRRRPANSRPPSPPTPNAGTSPRS